MRRVGGGLLVSWLLAACVSLPPSPSSTPAAVNGVLAPWLAQARAAMAQGDWPRAESALEQALRIDPREAAVWSALARLREAQGRWQQAERLRARACRLRRAQGLDCGGE